MLDIGGFEKLLLDMRARADELVTKEGAKILSEYNSAQKALREAKREIARSEWKLRRLREKIDEVEKTEVSNIPNEYINKFVAKYTKGFAPGDTAYVVRESFKKEKCDLCEGKKRLKVKSPAKKEGLIVDCPECGGRGIVRKASYEVKEEKIESVDLKLHLEKGRVQIWSSDTIRFFGADYSSTVANVYTTLEEAEAEANKLTEERPGLMAKLRKAKEVLGDGLQ